MFKQLFASMNDALDDIITQLPMASGAERAELEERLSVLKAMSDTCIEEWLLFEEKMGKLTGTAGAAPDDEAETHGHPSHSSVHTEYAMPVAASAVKESTEGSFSKGQGYYKLHMFRDAVEEFEQVVQLQPDFLMARIYLAMSYLRCGEYSDAYRHFQFLVPLTDDGKMKAISYNAMGYIQAENQNMDKAMEYFRLAHSADPGSVEPALHLKAWSKRS
ncbi:tetratricopeptide repeat protein [Gorillibacterium sp. sgz5001074]|uniref:tetratricopeptide repeat protein n=1 Tax=Gorillibacterium sp. sgz5001074 TaxID=3446695 RepID=UPI003F668138